jgi:hypothetical protein
MITRINKFKIIDELSPTKCHISITPRKKLVKYLLDNYSLTEMEYYNQVVFGNKDLIPKCKWCNGNLTFKSLGRGYGGDLCSPRCTNYWRNNYGDGGFNNPKCRERNIESNKVEIKNGILKIS